MGRRRSAVVVLLLLVAALAGCLGDGPSSLDETSGPSGASEEPAENGTSQGASEQDGEDTDRDGSSSSNGTEEGSSQTSNETEERPEPEPSEIYRIDILQSWDRTELLVAVVPAPHGSSPGETDPFSNSYTRAALDAVTLWQEAVQDHASSPLSGELRFDVRLIGQDTMAPTEQVDILVVNGPRATNVAGVASPGNLSPTCPAINLGQPTTDGYAEMFDTAAHEVGHCLGLSHPVDHKPWQDVMSYDWMHRPEDATPPRLHCTSNLNLRAIEEAFAPAFGEEPADQVEVPDIEYRIHDGCVQRFLGT